jgi:hypothetical protein
VKARAAKRADRTPHELDLMDLLKRSNKRERRVSDALIVILTRSDAKVLAALGTVVDFAVRAVQRAR